MGAASLNADYHVELIAGRELPKPLPKRLHWIIQARIFRELLKWEGSLDVEVGTEVDILCGPGHDERLVLDVAVVSKSGQYRDGVLVSGAILAVEIMSPMQTIGQLFDKCGKVHAADTRDCWVLWPKKRAAWHYSVGGLPIPAVDTLMAGTIRVDVAPLFANLPDDEESAS